ncbi:hypothetical protein SBOR_6843 [Sclerotinia borealis F-4128]|uniref:Uncharacterized protein n=1 Tax=Sclerotinia borealis (strain F-4128) TaxID=1432307 RepID=W9CAA9_SCLBF|nr:hypothetical protein SBOR_6843 [Sclerotinia borealis F-4128]
MSRNGIPCNNREEINVLGDDYGSRAGSCRVCDIKYRAASKYEAAVAAAESQFTAIVNAAWSKKIEEEERASYVIDTIPSIDRQKRPRRHSYHRYHHHRDY